MRGAQLGFTVTAVLTAALLAACTGNSTTAGSASPSATSSATTVNSSVPAPSAPITVAPSVVTVPPATTAPATTAPVSTSRVATTRVPTSRVPTSRVATSRVATSPVTTADTGKPTSSSTPPQPTATRPTSSSVKPAVAPVKAVPPAGYAASPTLGSTEVSPRTPITLRAARGTLAGVTLTNSEGEAVKGKLSADRTSWTLDEPLGYGSSYTLNGDAVNSAGKKVAIEGTYDTIDPDGLIGASISPGTGRTVGIAAPIMISLDTDINDMVGRQNIERAITVTTVPRTEGSFGWVRHDNGYGLDWRPKSYWQPGTRVTVTANLYGVSYGNGLWGQEDLTSQFTIGRSEITKADVNSHRLKVYRDGKLVFDFPTSYGLESDPGRVTHSGTYVVMSKEYLHLMSNPKYKYFNFKAYYAVRISNNGTFIHANDDTADVQGKKNVTHGCANLTKTNAKLFYDQTMYGDPVEVTGSSIKMSTSDGDVYDWGYTWDDWQRLSAQSTEYQG